MRAALLAAALAARAEGRGLQQVSWEWHREGTDPTTVGCMTKASECGAWCTTFLQARNSAQFYAHFCCAIL